jgi:hypothetical protein
VLNLRGRHDTQDKEGSDSDCGALSSVVEILGPAWLRVVGGGLCPRNSEEQWESC